MVSKETETIISDRKRISMNTGVSKKFCISIIGIQAIVQLSQDAPNKFIYACLIVGVVVVFKITQVVKDYLMKGEEK